MEPPCGANDCPAGMADAPPGIVMELWLYIVPPAEPIGPEVPTAGGGPLWPPP